MIEPNVFPTKHDFSYAASSYPLIGQLIEYGLTKAEANVQYNKHENKRKLNKKGRKYERRSKYETR